jgi:hypothetical protein
MKLKKPDLSKSQPSLAEYFGNAKENLDLYCSAFQTLYSEVDDSLEEETDEVASMVPGHGQEHGHTSILSGVRKPKKNLMQIKATLTADHPPITPPRQPCRDVSFPHCLPLFTFVHEWLS